MRNRAASVCNSRAWAALSPQQQQTLNPPSSQSSSLLHPSAAACPACRARLGAAAPCCCGFCERGAREGARPWMPAQPDCATHSTHATRAASLCPCLSASHLLEHVCDVELELVQLRLAALQRRQKGVGLADGRHDACAVRGLDAAGGEKRRRQRTTGSRSVSKLGSAPTCPPLSLTHSRSPQPPWASSAPRTCCSRR